MGSNMEPNGNQNGTQWETQMGTNMEPNGNPKENPNANPVCPPPLPEPPVPIPTFWGALMTPTWYPTCSDPKTAVPTAMARVGVSPGGGGASASCRQWGHWGQCG